MADGRPEIGRYCWSDGHFAKMDFSRVAFMQFVNDDMVLYRLDAEGGEKLYCAYPVDNAMYKKLARSRGMRFSEYYSVIP